MSLKSLLCPIELGRGISGRFRAFKSSVLIVLNKHMRRERPKRTSEKSYITQKIWNWFCIWPIASKNLIRDSFDWFSFPSDRARWRAAINWYWPVDEIYPFGTKRNVVWKRVWNTSVAILSKDYNTNWCFALPLKTCNFWEGPIWEHPRICIFTFYVYLKICRLKSAEVDLWKFLDKPEWDTLTWIL